MHARLDQLRGLSNMQRGRGRNDRQRRAIGECRVDIAMGLHAVTAGDLLCQGFLRFDNRDPGTSSGLETTGMAFANRTDTNHHHVMLNHFHVFP